MGSKRWSAKNDQTIIVAVAVVLLIVVLCVTNQRVVPVVGSSFQSLWQSRCLYSPWGGNQCNVGADDLQADGIPTPNTFLDIFQDPKGNGGGNSDGGNSGGGNSGGGNSGSGSRCRGGQPGDRYDKNCYNITEDPQGLYKPPRPTSKYKIDWGRDGPPPPRPMKT